MFALSVIVMAVLALWLVGAVIGLVFKCVFAVVGGVFGIIGAAFGLLFGGLALLIAAPFVVMALLPLFLPVLLLAALVWLVVRAGRRAPVAGGAH